MKNQRNYYPNIAQSWGIVGILILSMLLFIPVNMVLNDLLGPEVSFLIYYLLTMAVPLLFVHNFRRKITGNSNYNFELASFKIMGLLAISVIAIQTGIISPIVNSVPMPEFMKEVFLEFTSQNGIFSFISIVVVAPIIEELIFRGIILDGLLRKYSPVKSIVISSFLFGILHLNPWQFIGAFIIGLFSGWVYYRTKKLSLSILIHLVNNLIAFIGMNYMNSDTMMNETLTDQYGGFLNMVLIIVGAILASVYCVDLLRKEFSNLKIDAWQQQTKNSEPLANRSALDDDSDEQILG